MKQYYVKGNNIITTLVPHQASWVIKKIFNARTYAPGNSTIVLKHKLSISQIYRELRGNFQKVSWRKMLCNNYAPPKCTFITWLAIMGRLATCENLLKVGVHCDQVCSQCNKENETFEHLFFLCDFSYEVWSAILRWMGFRRNVEAWSVELQLLKQHNNNSVSHNVYRMAISMTVYLLWKERNARRFSQLLHTPNMIVRHALMLIYTRCYSVKKFASVV
ncbi:uncharacterized protein [Spinacia oleracea]|uniref:Reverse transcriptase zinc-binding domain-containing protein n=1 Tax=Spinacia oleracea TaxID=3562 RepID=A0ABM3R454_SPIOL|nr:uncharacterized protein LOC130465594 [Spinacia oleracea]